MNEQGKITQMLREWSGGDVKALESLMPLVYSELQRQAARFLSHERPDHTLQTSDLIHETYLKLVGNPDIEWEGRTHFFAIAANLMRRILVDHARNRNRQKRGGAGAVRLTLEIAKNIAAKQRSIDLIALDEALSRLAVFDEGQARIVELRYFAGLTLEETARALNLSRTTVATEWSMAKSWLHREMTR